MTRNPTREWNINRPVKAYIQILPMWVDRKNILPKINNAPFNHIQGKTTKTWLANVKRIFQGNNYLVLIGWDAKVRKLLPRTKKYKNKRYNSLSHVIRQTLNPPFLREKWLN